jgi:enoyl-[acyl-carrier-protein] reductase (NADH)
VGDMAVFLASDNAGAITGQCINVDCGVFPQ